MSDKNLLIGRAAQELGVTESTLRRLRDAGVVDALHVGSYRVFPADRLAEYKRAIAGAATPAQGAR